MRRISFCDYYLVCVFLHCVCVAWKGLVRATLLGFLHSARPALIRSSAAAAAARLGSVARHRGSWCVARVGGQPGRQRGEARRDGLTGGGTTAAAARRRARSPLSAAVTVCCTAPLGPTLDRTEVHTPLTDWVPLPLPPPCSSRLSCPCLEQQLARSSRPSLLPP
jgi:hypothetical protein